MMTTIFTALFIAFNGVGGGVFFSGLLTGTAFAVIETFFIAENSNWQGTGKMWRDDDARAMGGMGIFA